MNQLPKTRYNLRDAAMITRCHTVRTIKPQTVAEHSYHVAMILLRLCDGGASADLIKAALYHDLAEVSTGDVPANTKWRSPIIKDELQRLERSFEDNHDLMVDLSENEMLILKWADSIELAEHCLDEMRMGNMFVDEMFNNIYNFMLKLPEIKYSNTEMLALRRKYEHHRK